MVTGEPVLQHLAYKWEASSGAHVTTRYHLFPQASLELVQTRLGHIYNKATDNSSLDIALSVLESAAERCPADHLQYLEVIEDQNERKSFDLNLYEAGMTVKEIQAQLSRMRDHFGVKPGHFQALFDQVKNKTLGHLAGGVHRNDLDFFNLYYGMEGFPHFARSVDAD